MSDAGRDRSARSEADDAKLNAFAANTTDLKAYGFRQGGQQVTVVAADVSSYCMQAPGGTDTFKMTQDTGRPVSGTC